MLIGLLLLALVRLILHRLELVYSRRQKLLDHRRSSTIFYRGGRPTLSYTPVPVNELHRIIQGEHSSQQFSDTSSTSSNCLDLKPPKNEFLAQLVIRRDALESTPLTALLSPITHIDTINERRPNAITTVQHESIETVTLAQLQSNRSKIYDFYESRNLCKDRLMPSSSLRRVTATIKVEESFDYYSVHSIPMESNGDENC